MIELRWVEHDETDEGEDFEGWINTGDRQTSGMIIWGSLYPNGDLHVAYHETGFIYGNAEALASFWAQVAKGPR